MPAPDIFMECAGKHESNKPRRRRPVLTSHSRKTRQCFQQTVKVRNVPRAFAITGTQFLCLFLRPRPDPVHDLTHGYVSLESPPLMISPAQTYHSYRAQAQNSAPVCGLLRRSEDRCAGGGCNLPTAGMPRFPSQPGSRAKLMLEAHLPPPPGCQMAVVCNGDVMPHTDESPGFEVFLTAQICVDRSAHSALREYMEGRVPGGRNGKCKRGHFPLPPG